MPNKYLLNKWIAVVVQSLSHVWLFVTPWTAACQASLSFTISWSLLKLMSIELVIQPSIQPSHPQSPPSPPALNLSQHQAFPMSWHFALGGQSIRASASTSVFPVNIQDWFPLELIIWSLCSSRDSQESSPAPQFKSTSSLTLSFLYGLTLTSVHDYWKNHSFDHTDLCWQSNVSAF